MAASSAIFGAIYAARALQPLTPLKLLAWLQMGIGAATRGGPSWQQSVIHECEHEKIRPNADLRHGHPGSINPITENPMLIVLGGLPGTGKTAIARELVARSPCAYLRIDAIEQALMKASVLEEIGPAGYAVAYALARSNLALGMTVVADCVNPLLVTREAWRAAAASTSSGLLEVEVVCSDPAEHRRRVESRKADIPGLTVPIWEAVLRHEYEAWTESRLVIDSALVSASGAANLILERLQSLAAGE